MEDIRPRCTSGSKGPGNSPRVSTTGSVAGTDRCSQSARAVSRWSSYDKMAANSATTWADLWTTLSEDNLTGWVNSRVCQIFEIEKALYNA